MKNVTVPVAAVLALVLGLGGCKKDAAEDAGKVLAKMTELRDEMCKCRDARCAQDVSDKMSTWMQEQSKGKATPPNLSAEATKQAAAIGEEMSTCMQTAMAASTPPAPTPATGSDTTAPPDMSGAGSATVTIDGVPAECAAYKEQVEKLKTCEKLPPKAKEALISAFNDAAKSWATMPEGAKVGLATSCKRGTEALVAAAKEACGW